LSLSPTVASGKPILPIRYSPTVQEGQYIRYRSSLAGVKLASIARSLNLDRSTVSKVIRGLRRSARIEAEIARILGHSSWNDVVLEARSETQKKPVKAILREMEQRAIAARKSADRRMAEYAAQNAERADRAIREGLASIKRRGA